MSYQLAISTSSKQGSLCVAKDFENLYSINWTKHNAHAELITKVIDDAFRFLDLKPEDIEHFICDIGPGSFTGVRVATSSIKTLAYHVKHSKIIPINANDLLAQGLNAFQKPVCTIINAQRNDFYTAFYEPGKSKILCKSKSKLMSIVDISKHLKKQHLLVGDGAEIFMQAASASVKMRCFRGLIAGYDYPLAEKSLAYARQIVKLNKTIDWKSLEPLYIRSSSAEEKLKNGDLEIVRNYVRRKNK